MSGLALLAVIAVVALWFGLVRPAAEPPSEQVAVKVLSRLKVEGVAPRMTRAEALRILGEPQDVFEPESGRGILNYPNDVKVFFERDRVQSVYGHKLTLDDRLIASAGEPVEVVEKTLGTGEVSRHMGYDVQYQQVGPPVHLNVDCDPATRKIKRFFLADL